MAFWINESGDKMRNKKITEFDDLVNELNMILANVDWDHFNFSPTATMNPQTGLFEAPTVEVKAKAVRKLLSETTRHLKQAQMDWLTELEQKQLSQALQSDPEIRERFVNWTIQHASSDSEPVTTTVGSIEAKSE